ncbi:alpha/beta hydrolase [Reichenbachiella carrageenanivorans]|uniref:Alpha/beta hydrolase n=1 Tax=Reichenbachiella carrageenanivorans TaxID=2979869 RepID=A0ABY6D770_9BACT|nr:alpha/beta hydrolase [Reichenbachiella carrageenanivorans]UXX79685.1 alpha/beta hydrolase [Reichenbachiella carrageenanivorans]
MKKLIQLYFRFLSSLSPKLAANQAFELFQKPLNKKIRKKELPFYETAKSFSLKHQQEDIQCYELGDPTHPLVLMVHGWESNAASLSAIATPLAEAGHHVILFNLPAHGYSKLKKTNIKRCKDVFLAVVAHLQPKGRFSIISHSFGSAVTSFALSKSSYAVDQLIFLTSPNEITNIFKEFANFIGLSQKSFHHLCRKAEAILHEPLDHLKVEGLGNKIDYQNLLIIHDKDDKIIPKSNAEEITKQWANADLKLIEKTGHYKMLWNDQVIDHIVWSLTKNKEEHLKKMIYATAF